MTSFSGSPNQAGPQSTPGDDAEPDDDVVLILDDEEGLPEEGGRAEPWQILVVDDDEEVHRATAFALSNVTILERGVQCVHARSAAQALEILRERPDFALILLDVVMESEDAGLRLVRDIRSGLGLMQTRIVLRTGQPGYAPETRVMQDYDINDYRTKSELNQTRLLTSLTSALRAYQQILTIEATRDGLRKIVEVSSQMFRNHMLKNFADGILSQICEILSIPPLGVVVSVKSQDLGLRPKHIVAAAGEYVGLEGQPMGALPPGRVADLLNKSMDRHGHVFERDAMVLYVTSPSMEELMAFVPLQHPLSGLRRQLLEVFSTNLRIGLYNASLFEKMSSLAFEDQLTKVGNRNHFHRSVTSFLDRECEGTCPPVAVLILDVDGFQNVNDGLGFETGDETLIRLAHRLELVVARPSSVSRISADVFGIVYELPRDGDPVLSSEVLAEALQAAIAKPLVVTNGTLTLTACAGVCLIDAEDHEASALIRKAVTAVKTAKRKGPGHLCMFSPSMAVELERRLSVVRQLGQAFDTSQLCLYAQPFIRLPRALSDGDVSRQDAQAGPEIIGSEVLLRWKQPDGTVLPPASFIQAAEESGLIVPLGEWVLREACLRQTQWRDQGLPPLRMAVNVSVRQIHNKGFIDTVRRVLEETSADPTCIELELTESLAMDERILLDTMHALRDLGVSLSIDDFGTGYSSLSRLRRLPVDRLKVDQSFVRGLATVSECQSIVSMIIGMGHSLGLSIIAEGVETIEQERELIRLGCEEAQGYFYQRPIPVDQMTELLAKG